MVDYRTLSRIASARYDAQRMRLPGTADRLEILRKELERYHEVPENKREIKRRWAIAKLEDIERTYRTERGRLNGEDELHFGQMRAVCRLIQISIWLFFTVNVIGSLSAGMQTYAGIGATLGGNALIALGSSAIVGRFFGGDFNSVTKKIERTIRKCKQRLDELGEGRS